MEGMPKYIIDSLPRKVPCTSYYRRLVDDGSLILVNNEKVKIPKSKP